VASQRKVDLEESAHCDLENGRFPQDQREENEPAYKPDNVHIDAIKRLTWGFVF
jgi:hypothetical protein